MLSAANTILVVDAANTRINRILSFDLEWALQEDQYGGHPILAAAFVDTDGYSKAILLEDFQRNGNRIYNLRIGFERVINKCSTTKY
jgi:hypothetical protein